VRNPFDFHRLHFFTSLCPEERARFEEQRHQFAAELAARDEQLRNEQAKYSKLARLHPALFPRHWC
jgi:hypothetical protein